MSNTNERTELIAALRLLAQISGGKLVTQAADMLESFALELTRLREIARDAAGAATQLQKQVLILKAQQVSVPAKIEPLSVAEVEQMLGQWDYEIHGDRARYIVRMTEQAHGITQGDKT